MPHFVRLDVEKRHQSGLLPSLQGLLFKFAVPRVVPVKVKSRCLCQIPVINDRHFLVVGDKSDGYRGNSSVIEGGNDREHPGF